MIRLVRQSDVVPMYEAFLESQVSTPTQKRGFYKYELGYDEFERRAMAGLSLITRTNQVEAYVIGTPPSFVSGFDELPYLDQLFLQHHHPIWKAGRIMDVFDWQLQSERFAGVTTAIPQSPWKNKASTRFALFRGFAPIAKKQEEDLQLGIFSKPYA